MSDPDQGDDKGFLARWSQRKQEAREPKPDAPATDAAGPAEPAVEKNVAEEFDLSSLPRLEELTETTDITGFLRKGVPEHLRNAALRKSWALDPAIRNYVNPAMEYAYDWNTPGGVPGSGELGASVDVARLVSRIMGSGEPPADPSNPAAVRGQEAAGDSAAASGDPATQQAKPELPTETTRLAGETAPVSSSDASEADEATGQAPSNSAAPQQPVRRHGSAKPIV
jgi:hypothetical protein